MGSEGRPGALRGDLGLLGATWALGGDLGAHSHGGPWELPYQTLKFPLTLQSLTDREPTGHGPALPPTAVPAVS